MVRMHLATYFRQRRLEMGWSVAEVVRRLGYKNISKGMRRVAAFEQAGYIDSALLTKLAAVLEIDRKTLNRLAYQDYRYWFAVVNPPITPCVFRRILFGGGVVYLPSELKTHEAREQFAADFARRCNTDVCLMISPRVKIWFAHDGSLLEIVEEVPHDI
jgi:transcriptional regulator with XRE-family HTH domain